MAKNMQNTSYRKLDVDAFDPEQYDENDETVDTPGLGPDERAVQGFLSSNRLEDALHASLLSPPLKTKDQNVKDRATQLVTKVLQSFKNAEIEQTVQKLSIDEGDILMKYVYKAMELGADAAVCQSLLAWHAQLVAKFGHGAIMRVFSGRQRL
ncbi:hypothetical protein CAEBREN_23949 [Caenorhabditis brenneri]|uniref:Actin-related protein 2/3 complex subunit 5 n=1 Tax=Caenorhabditis brenneri TaxID=135651 RepID=G0PEM0_CAEBE|nr:hypothetical protein CAEBREN_20566 [Caenorhabditis brenneri]EGT53101.1 hypothetical protein CAEBREN_23949 [Caenorhabditis brenneri]